MSTSSACRCAALSRASAEATPLCSDVGIRSAHCALPPDAKRSLAAAALQEANDDEFFKEFEKYMAKVGSDTFSLLTSRKWDPNRLHRLRALSSFADSCCTITQAGVVPADSRCGNATSKKSKVSGRGDGSMIGQKATTMRVYMRSELLEDVIIYAVVPFSFGKKEGSKGANGICMRVFDTTVALVNCHLTASVGKAGALQKRQLQYAKVVDILGNKLGNEYFQLNGQFHHVVWMGDMNYRLTGGLEMADCASIIKTGGEDIIRMHDKHDELALELGRGSIYLNYTEPEKDWPNFNPSYKKVIERTVEDTSDPDWVDKVYLVDYKQQWYKGGKKKLRMPGWTDRFLIRSQHDCKENISCSDYNAITSTFHTSDHSPVQCMVNLNVKKIPECPVCMYKIRLHNVRCHKSDGSPSLAKPNHVKVLAPAPYELDSDRPPVAKKCEIDEVEPGKPGKAWFFVGLGLQLHQSDVGHHILMKVNLSHTLKGECTVGVKLADFVLGKTMSFDEALEYDGIALIGPDAVPLYMSFDMEFFAPAGMGDVIIGAQPTKPISIDDTTEPEPEEADDE